MAHRPLDPTWHRLAVVLQFDDVFSGELVRVPLDVEIPELGWRAIRGADGTYRFVMASAVPAGSYGVAVRAPGGEYRNFEPISISLPHAAPVPPTRQGWIIQRPLWPTPSMRIGADMTTLRLRLETAGLPQSARKVRLRGGMGPTDPYTFSDREGELIAYFPHARRDTDAAPPATSLQLAIEIDDGAVSASPSTVTVPMGTVRAQRIEIL